MRDYWPGDGCGFMQFRRHPKDGRAKQRRALLREYADRAVVPGDKPVWPFVHDAVPLAGVSQPLDPLAVPMVEWLRTVPGLTTITSCQGHADGSPYFYFRGGQEAAMAVMEHMCEWRQGQKVGGYFLNYVLMLAGVRDEEPAWMLQMYDTFALMRLNADTFGVPVNYQMHDIPDAALGGGRCEVLADIAAIQDAVAGKKHRRRS